jgi:hypothetical protein
MADLEEIRRRAKILIYERPLLREAYTTIQGAVAQGPIIRRLREVLRRVRDRIGR